MVQSIGNKGDYLHFCMTDRAYQRENLVDALPATSTTDNATGSDDATFLHSIPVATLRSLQCHQVAGVASQSHVFIGFKVK